MARAAAENAHQLTVKEVLGVKMPSSQVRMNVANT